MRLIEPKHGYNRHHHFYGISFAALFMIISICHGQSDSPRREPAVISKITIKDPEWIEQILSDQQKYVEDIKAIERIEIFDLLNDGPGENDVALIFPQNDILPLTQIGEKLQSEMNLWPLVASSKYIFRTEDLDLDEFENSGILEKAMAGTLFRGIDHYYHDIPVKIVIERNDSLSHFRMWGFNSDSLRYAPPGTYGSGNAGFDVYHVLQADTTVVADTTMYDVIYVYRTYGDTIYVPKPTAAGSNAGR